MRKPHRWLPTLLLIIGGLLLFWASLVSVKPLLSNYQLVEGDYLLFPQQVNLPLPKIDSIRSTEPAPQDVFHSLVYNPYTPTPTITPTPTPVPAGPVKRLIIPSIGVDRSVVPLRQYRDASGVIQYDTNSLFATNTRLDLVGQTLTSVDPGQGSNIVLVGHNYNMGWYAWEGVFVNLKKLKPGAEIILHTKSGGVYKYQVTKVVQVPYVARNAAELNQHLRYLGPTGEEQVTLVTCGGAFGSWSARIYVVAK